ncbi:hypothetical protein J2S89_000357 [Arthrobacter bambusae]|nr:hypothetical protein [Arthrobacter bambusae]MDQ0096657.1 hypothetical protein [Arthrobacter bambusae]
MGNNVPWIFVLLVPSLGFFFYLVIVNIRVTLRRKALGLPPLGLVPRRLGHTPRRLGHRHRKRINYVVVDDPAHPDGAGSAQKRAARTGRFKRSLSWAKRRR